MKFNEIIEVLSFPIRLDVASENYSATVASKEMLALQFMNYTVKEITTDASSGGVVVALYKVPRLEELGFSFEAGM